MNRLIIIFLSNNIILGTIIVITSNHWFLIWMGLEINTLSIIPIIISSQTTRNTEATIKYFIINAIAAAIILNSALINTWETGSWLINNPINNLNSILIISALSLKISMAPFHLWFPDVISGTNLVQGLILTTWQKIAPTIIILNIINSINTNIIIISTILSIIVGSWGGLNQTNTRKIMAYSSITHIGWIILIGIFNQEASLIIFTIYIIINTSIFILIINNNIKNINSINKNNIISPWIAPLITLSILSLGGLPPFTGFINKFISLNVLINNNAILITIPLIIGSLVSLFFYLRIAFNSNLIIFPNNSLLINNIRNKENNFVIITSATTIIALSGLVILPTIISITA
uniref:NADH-ubiquinone oxidoreductase chain 2 n=1 Tax=Hyocrinidae sp. TaxID=3078845 RepID=A0AA96S0J1_9ECHI|nr:NADH dehydrogenase subunit 2 [Hyocrinidae sp.]